MSIRKLSDLSRDDLEAIITGFTVMNLREIIDKTDGSIHLPPMDVLKRREPIVFVETSPNWFGYSIHLTTAEAVASNE
jgi:hypothetical protein